MRSCFLLLTLLWTGAAPAADFTPNRPDDPVPNGCTEDCSLREAVIAANAAPGADRILLAQTTYVLTRLATGAFDESDGALWIKDDTEVVGGGVTGTRVRWGAAVAANDSVFVLWNADPVPLTVTLRDLTISHGRGSSGGCVYIPKSYSTFAIERAVIEHCAAQNGGGLSLNQSTLTLREVKVRENTASIDGGGARLSHDATLLTYGSRFDRNVAARDGGGLSFLSGGLTAAKEGFWFDDGNTIVSRNQAGRYGGGVAVLGQVSVLIESAGVPADAMLTITNNEALDEGGGLARLDGDIDDDASLTLSRLRILDNAAPVGGGVVGLGPVEITDSELRGNLASTGAGGGLALGADAYARVTRTSFTANSAATEGGGVYAGCQDVSLRNVSMQRNSAAEGQAVLAAHGLLLNHVTLFRNFGGGAALFRRYDPACGAVVASMSNSLIAGTCAAPDGLFASEGGNQYGPAGVGCPLGTQDMLQTQANPFGMGIKKFGAPFPVTGWPSDGQARPQVNFGLSSHCMPDDVRGLPRSAGACDAGAFEAQGTTEL